jgi:NTP pyrophosphatase (non-canonical NTP hydrolase)
MPTLKPDPTLSDFQTYVAKMMVERGFAGQPVLQECLLLTEEVGELCKAIRKEEQLGIDAKSKVGTISEELSDILIVILAIANRYEIDLEQAFRDKEAINHKRVWQ